MSSVMGKPGPEHIAGLMFVIVLHFAVLYGLWSYHILPTPNEALALMVDLINPAPPEQAKPLVPEPPKPKKIIEPPKPQQLVAETQVVMPDEPAALPPPPEPVVVPPQPVMLSGELSVSCPERAPPDYPAFSKRLNEQGRVVLRVELGVDGHIANASYATRSGYARLDEAAMNAVKTWRCKPAIRDGMAVVAVALQPFVFTLEEH